MEWRRGDYLISTDPGRLQPDVIVAFLGRAYWSKNRPRELVLRSLRHSSCFGLYRGDAQVGFARLVTDHATFAYLADVFVLEEHRGQGLAGWLLEVVISQPDVKELRRVLLATADAHELYRRYGFRGLEAPERWMERVNPDV